jgi:hypothetical protein
MQNITPNILPWGPLNTPEPSTRRNTSDTERYVAPQFVYRPAVGRCLRGLERRWPRALRHTSSKLFATLNIDVNVDGKPAIVLPPHLLEVARSNWKAVFDNVLAATPTICIVTGHQKNLGELYSLHNAINIFKLIMRLWLAMAHQENPRNTYLP